MDQPIVAGFLRGLIAAALVGIIRGVNVYDGPPWENEIIEGAKVSLPALLALTGYGTYDQYRANTGKVVPSDVPIVIAADKQHRSATAVARDFAPTKVGQ